MNKALRAVAVIEALKGAVVFVAATGLLSLLHRNIGDIAAMLVRHAHLNPASRYPQIFLDAASRLHDTRLLMLAAGAGTYSLLRFVEAYGLFRERAWAEVLASVSGAIYVPFEVAGLLRHPSWHGLVLLLVNLAVVAVMVQALARRRGSPAAGRR